MALLVDHRCFNRICVSYFSMLKSNFLARSPKHFYPMQTTTFLLNLFTLFFTAQIEVPSGQDNRPHQMILCTWIMGLAGIIGSVGIIVA